MRLLLATSCICCLSRFTLRSFSNANVCALISSNASFLGTESIVSSGSLHSTVSIWLDGFSVVEKTVFGFAPIVCDHEPDAVDMLVVYVVGVLVVTVIGTLGTYCAAVLHDASSVISPILVELLANGANPLSSACFRFFTCRSAI